MFVGRIDDDPVYDSKSGTVSISLVGLAEAKLEHGSAQKVGTELLNQVTSPAQGDGSNLSFDTQTKSLWQVKNVRVNAVVKTQGTHYTADDLNDAEVNTFLTFTAGNAPGNLLTVLWDGDQWYRDKSISELVVLICEAAGITSAYRIIEEPIFTGVDQSITIGTSAAFALGTLTNAEVTSLDGWLRRRWFLLDAFTDGDFTADPAWVLPYGATTPVVTAGKLIVGGNSANGKIMYAEHDRQSGSWEMSITHIAAAPFLMMILPFMNRAANGVGFLIQPTGNNAILLCDANRTGIGAPTGATIPDDGTEHTVRITLTPTPSNPSQGTYRLYLDSVLVDTAVSTVHAADSFMIANSNPGSAAGDCIKLDNIYFSNAALTPADAVETTHMKWKSEERDLLAAPAAWLPMEITKVLNGGTITVSTDVASASGGPYDGELPVDGTNTPTSALKRYAKLVIESTIGSFGQAPEIDQIILNWRGSSLFIKSADFSGMTCIQAIDELAKMGGMDYGTNGAGIFYFRNRTVSGAADIELSQKNAIIEVSSYKSGYKDVRPRAEVRYGKSGTDGYYFSEYGATEAGEASPTTAERFGSGDTVPTEKLDLTSFIFSNNASVAAAIAQKLYEEKYRPKRWLRLRCRIIPHLDSGDKVLINFHDSPLIENAIFGDPLQKFPVTGPNARTIARDILMKVVGISHDINKSETVLDLEEVLT